MPRDAIGNGAPRIADLIIKHNCSNSGIEVRELVPVHADFNFDLCRLGPEGLRTRLTDEAASLLAAKLKTPLQIGQHLVRAFEAGFETGVKPSTPLSSRRFCPARSMTSNPD